MVRRLLYLRTLPAPPTTYICAIGPNFIPLPSAPITSLLHQACSSLGNPHGFLARDITAKSLRASGAMALLNEQVDHDLIQLLGRWKSDSMLRYLHIQAHDLMKNFSPLMLQGGNYNLIPTLPDTPL